MKRYIKATSLDFWGNKIPDVENVKQDFEVNQSYNVYTEEDLDADFLGDILGADLTDYEDANLYRPGRGIILKVGTPLLFDGISSHYAFYRLPTYNNLKIAVNTGEWFNLRRHVKPLKKI